MTVIECAQRSDVWRQARIGRVCASDAADMLSMIKSGEAAVRRDLRLRLVCERLTNQSQDDGFVNAAMQRGIDCEAEARAAYESCTGRLVQEVGFVAHDTLLAGCSPDGVIDGFRRLVEIKAPKSATHLGYVRAQKVPSTYLPQLTHQLFVTGADAVDFFSWDGRFPEELQTFLVTLKRSDVDMAAYELALRLFLSEVQREYEDVAKLAGVAA